MWQQPSLWLKYSLLNTGISQLWLVTLLFLTKGTRKTDETLSSQWLTEKNDLKYITFKAWKPQITSCIRCTSTCSSSSGPNCCCCRHLSRQLFSVWEHWCTFLDFHLLSKVHSCFGSTVLSLCSLSSLLLLGPLSVCPAPSPLSLCVTCCSTLLSV